MEFQIDVVEKVARVIGTPIIVCGNSDYTVRFTFDSEWLDKVTKTARFVWVKNGETQFEEVVFTGSVAKVPVLSGITCVQIGVYAGALQTTTPARVPCMQSILCSGGAEHDDPPQDVYNQLIAMLEGLTVDSPITLALEEQNAGKAVSIWVGTRAQYDAIPESSIVADRFYFVTDDTGAEDIDQMRDDIAGILSGAKVVSHASFADRATSAGLADSAERLADGTDKDLLTSTANYVTRLSTGKEKVAKAETADITTTTDFTNAGWWTFSPGNELDVNGRLQANKTYQAHFAWADNRGVAKIFHLAPFTPVVSSYEQTLPSLIFNNAVNVFEPVLRYDSKGGYCILSINFTTTIGTKIENMTTDEMGNPITIYIREIR